MDERDRNKFYSPPDESDDDEYELEAPDEEAEARRRQAILDSIEPTIDIDEIYREANRDRGSEILQDWTRNFRGGLRFQVKHLLIATAVLAIALTLVKLHLFWPAIIVLIMLSVFALQVYLTLEEQKRQRVADRKREELYARRRAKLAARTAGYATGGPAPNIFENNDAQSPDEADHDHPAPAAKEPFRFQFSLRELLIVMTTAAVVLGMIQMFGGPAAAATVLGFIALVGLVIYAMGYEPPAIVVFGWWLTLALYLLVNCLTAIWSRFA